MYNDKSDVGITKYVNNIINNTSMVLSNKDIL